jgi:hypothetical protein
MLLCRPDSGLDAGVIESRIVGPGAIIGDPEEFLCFGDVRDRSFREMVAGIGEVGQYRRCPRFLCLHKILPQGRYRLGLACYQHRVGQEH